MLGAAQSNYSLALVIFESKNRSELLLSEECGFQYCADA